MAANTANLNELITKIPNTLILPIPEYRKPHSFWFDYPCWFGSMKVVNINIDMNKGNFHIMVVDKAPKERYFDGAFAIGFPISMLHLIRSFLSGQKITDSDLTEITAALEKKEIKIGFGCQMPIGGMSLSSRLEYRGLWAGFSTLLGKKNDGSDGFKVLDDTAINALDNNIEKLLDKQALIPQPEKEIGFFNTGSRW